MSRQAGRSPNPALRAARRYISLGWSTVQISLQRGHPTVLYTNTKKKCNSRWATDRKSLVLTLCKSIQWTGRLVHLFGRSLSNRGTQTAARDANSAVWGVHNGWFVKEGDWDSRQLLPSWRGWIWHKVALSEIQRVHKHSDQMCHYVIRWRVMDGGARDRERTDIFVWETLAVMW